MESVFVTSTSTIRLSTLRSYALSEYQIALKCRKDIETIVYVDIIVDSD